MYNLLPEVLVIIFDKLFLFNLFRVRVVCLQWKSAAEIVMAKMDKLSICPGHNELFWYEKQHLSTEFGYDRNNKSWSICHKKNNLYFEGIEEIDLNPVAQLFPNLTHLAICGRIRSQSNKPLWTAYNSFIEKSAKTLQVIDTENMKECKFVLTNKNVIKEMKNLSVFRVNECDYYTLLDIFKNCSDNLEEIVLQQGVLYFPYYPNLTYESDFEENDEDPSFYKFVKPATDAEIQIEKCINISLPKVTKFELQINDYVDLVRLIPMFESMKNLKELTITAMNFTAKLWNKYWMRIFRSLQELQVLRLNGMNILRSKVLGDTVCPKLHTIEIEEWD